MGSKKCKLEGRLRVRQEEWRGPLSGPRDVDPGHQATGETGIQSRPRDENWAQPGARAPPPAPGGGLGRRDLSPEARLREGAAGDEGRLLAFPALAPLPLRRSSAGP